MTGPDEDEIPEQTADDTAVGWGDDAAEADADRDAWYLAERPPHHGT